MQRIYRAGDDDVSATVTSRGGMSQQHAGRQWGRPCWRGGGTALAAAVAVGVDAALADVALGMMMSAQRSHHVGGCRNSTLAANGGVHVGVCGTWDSVVVLYRGCYGGVHVGVCGACDSVGVSYRGCYRGLL